MKRTIEQWITDLRARGGNAEIVLRQMEAWLEEFVQFAEQQGLVDWDQVTLALIKRWQAHLLRAGYDRSTVTHCLATLHALLDDLVREGQIKSHPMAKSNLPARPQLIFDHLSAREMAQLLAQPDLGTPLGLRDRAILEVLYSTGSRVGEVVAFNVGDVDPSYRSLTIWRNSVRRRVPIDDVAAEVLKAYLTEARPQLTSGRATPALFLNYRGGRMSKIAVNQLVSRYVVDAGIDRRVTPQMISHTLPAHLMGGGLMWQEMRRILASVDGHGVDLGRRIGRDGVQ
ncbi:MAG: site-specific tyrosine recombinase XerD [Anaerolineae bacterium]